jgi:diguanylate cyclase (GGDEF)-like protein/PAS domain S-box-containing protein
MQHILDAILELDILSSPKDYAMQIMQILCEGMEFEFGVVHELLSEDNTVAIFSAYNMSVEYPRVATLEDLCILEEDKLNPQVLYFNITNNEISGLMRQLYYNGTRSMVIVPLVYKDEVFGFYELYDNKPREINDELLLLLARIAELVSVAVTSNKYLEQLNVKTFELQTEIVERKRVESALRDALRKRKELEEIINRSPVVVCLWGSGKDYPFEYVSQSIEQFGYSMQELVDNKITLFSLIPNDDVDRVKTEIALHSDSGENDFIITHKINTKNGKFRWVENHIWLRHDTDGLDLLTVVTGGRGIITHLQGIMLDITERKHAEEIIRHQAFHDNLTDLPNRVLFQDRLTHALSSAKRNHRKMSVMFLDLDRFKTINDTLGHPMGDLLLKEVSRRLRMRLRSEDTVARLGGDEFTMLLPDIRMPEDAAEVARSLLSAVNMPYHLEDHELHIGCSIGIAMFPEDGHDSKTLLQNADTALYQAKEHGRNNFQFYSSTMTERALEKMTLENELRHALTKQQFTLHYQPQIEISSGKVIGTEALLRWNHPGLGSISPAKFIPIAEETGMIDTIGMWVIEQACAQNAQWQRAGYPPMTVAVNLSSRQFYQDNLKYCLQKTLAETGLDPQYLEIEITESVVVRNIDYTVGLLREFRDMGIKLSMDDFGTGYSSLSYLKILPLNTLKIDQSFIRGITADIHDRAISAAIITMGNSLGLRVIAEGVEIHEQLSLLKDLGCYGCQGYLFSKPVSAIEAESLLNIASKGIKINHAGSRVYA